MRADAQANRAKLLQAAEAVFVRDGAHAPLQRIAQEAGVGRGTLYRHFPDRISLVVALFTERISKLVSIGPDGTPEDRVAENILKETLDIQKATPGLTRMVVEESHPVLDALTEQSKRLEEYLDGPIHKGIEAGRIQNGITGRDFLISWAMFEGATGAYSHENYASYVARARNLILRAILTPEAFND